MAYTSIDDPTIYFNTVLYTGNGTAGRTVTGVGFQPQWLWVKERSSTSTHSLTDIVRGASKRLQCATTDAEFDSGTDNIRSFDSDGFTTGTGAQVNENTQTYVSWNWLANGTGSSNTNGDINSTVSVNTTAGFSIVSYTGTGSNATIGHGLGVAPAFMMIKNRDAAQGWCIYHHKNTSAPQTDFLSINSTDSTVDASDRWNDTAPTSNVFSVANHADTNGSSATYIGYFFNEVKGYSKFGSYTGNGNADGAFVYTGFKPAWLLIKPIATASWRIWDNKREDYNGNVNQTTLNANENGVEYDDSSVAIDFLSNGFKGRSSNSDISGSGTSYIYMAFAESPFVNSNGVPCNAR
jgi:hypothetical protein